MTVREKIILDAEDRASAKFDKASKSFGGLSSNLKRLALGGGLAIAGLKMVGFTKDVVQAGIAGAEAASAFDKTFGPAVGRMGDFVDDFANKAGFTTDTLQQMLAVTGNIVQGLGGTEEASAQLSTRMATLAADVASFSNASGGATAVLQALQSAVTGQRMALKTYGLAIDETEVQQQALLETGKSNVDELTRLDKAMATVTLASEKAGKAVGDLERTQDSAANTVRRVKAEWGELKGTLGAELLPVIQDLLPVMEDLVKSVGPPMVKGTRAFAGALEDLITFASIFGGDTGPQTRTVLKLIRQGMLENLDPAKRFAAAMATIAQGGELDANSLSLVSDALDLNGEAYGDALTEARAYFARIGDVDAYNILTQATRDFNVEQIVSGERLAASDGWLVKWQNDLQRASGATDKATSKASNYALTQKQVAIALWKSQQAQRSLSNALLDAADPVFGAIDSFTRYQDTLAQVNEDGKVTADEQLELARATLEMTAAFDQVDSSNIEDAITALTGALGVSRDEARDLLLQLGLIDGLKISADVELNLLGSGANFIPEGSSLGGTATRDPFAGTRNPGGGPLGVVGFAAGGISTADQLAFVHSGEIVINPADNGGAAIAQLGDRIIESLRTGRQGTTLTIERLEVNGAIGTEQEREAQAANLVATVERLLRS